MRVLIALGGHALLRRGIAIEPGARRRDIDAAAQALARIAAEHEVVVAHDSGVEVGSILELGLRNAIPDREVVTVLSQVVVGGEEAVRGAHSESPLARPRAIVGLRGLRTLIEAGALVICATGEGIPVAIDGDGTMRVVDAEIDRSLIAGLLARRLDADLLLMLTDVEARPGMVETACSFVEVTGRRAAIGTITDAVEMVRGAAGTQIGPVTARA